MLISNAKNWFKEETDFEGVELRGNYLESQLIAAAQ